MIGKCKDCKWWFYIDVLQDAPKQSFGECRRYPPAVIGAMCNRSTIFLEDNELDGVFPNTNSWYWCGEFKAKK